MARSPCLLGLLALVAHGARGDLFEDSAADSMTTLTYNWEQAFSEVSPRLQSTRLDCASCNTKCSARAAGSSDFCNDSPGLAGIAIDHCTRQLAVVTTAGPRQACTGGVSGNKFLLPGFSPSMALASFEYLENPARMNVVNKTWTPLNTFDMNSDAVYITGLPSKATDGRGNCATDAYTYTPTGVDLGDVQFLTRDTFIGTDKYGPRVLVWSHDGKILATYAPAGLVGDDASGRVYTNMSTHTNVKGVLPAIFAARGADAGLSALALSPNRNAIVVCMAGPLTGAGLAGTNVTFSASASTSRALRCAMVDITDIYRPKLTSQKIVALSDVNQEYGVPAAQQASVRVGGAAMLTDTEALLMETVPAANGRDHLATFHKVDFSTGDDIKDTAKYNDVAVNDGRVAGVAALETAANHDGVSFMTRTKVVDFKSGALKNPPTGVAIANDYNLVIAENGGFADYSKVHVVRLTEGLGWTNSTCPAASSKAATPRSAASGNSTVTTYTLPSQMLAGTVNPHLPPTTALNCAGCNVPCNSDGKVAGAPCNDAPGLSGVSFDACTGHMTAVTSRGPVQTCSDAGATGFALPDFTPAAMSFELHTVPKTQEPKLVVKAWTELDTKDGAPVTGLPTKATDGRALLGRTTLGSDVCGAYPSFQPRPSGLALDEVHTLYDGMSIGVDQYAPKVVVWNSTGNVVATYIPAGMAATYTDANTGSAVTEVLPAVFAGRAMHKGLSALAVSPSKDRAVVCMKASITGEGVQGAARYNAAANSRLIRCAVLNIYSPMSPKLVAEKVHVASAVVSQYSVAMQGAATAQADLEYSAAAWLRDEKVVLVERGNSDADHVAVSLIELDFSTGTDIKGSKFASLNDAGLDENNYVKGVVALEGRVASSLYGGLGALEVREVTATRVFDLNTVGVGSRAARGMSDNIDGITLINSHTAVLVESNAFGVAGTGYSKVHVVNMNDTVTFEPNCRPKTSDELTQGQLVGIVLGGLLLTAILVASAYMLAGAGTPAGGARAD